MTRHKSGHRRLKRRRISLEPGTVEILAQAKRFLARKRALGYVVGGFVRDLLLGERAKDLDLVVSGVEPIEVASHLHQSLALSRPVVFPRFRTALTVGRGVQIEICGLRESLEADAAVRDFTMNCIYAEIGSLVDQDGRSRMLDPTGRGLRDLSRAVMSTPADPCRTFWLDPLRILRAFRLGAVRGFRPDGDLRGSIPRLVYLLSGIAAERVRNEIAMILLSRRVISTFRSMQTLGVCEIVLPELSRTSGFDQRTPYHAYDLFTHTLKTTANTPARIELRLAALLHDLGKPASLSMKEGRAVYYGHDDRSAQLAERVLRRLKFPGRIRDRVLFLVSNHMIHYSSDWSDKAVRRFVRKMGPHLDMMLLLAEADQRAQVRGGRRKNPAGELRERIDSLCEADAMHLRPPLDGHEIMSVLGIEEGPMVGEAKNRLLEEASARGKPMTRREAVSVLKKWSKSRKPR